jgi:hypothetical protein
MNENNQPSLPPHEWLAVVTIVFVMALLVMMTHCQSPLLPSTSTSHYIASQHVEITILGEVESPGTYVLPVGSTLDMALKMAKPLESADLKRLKMEAKVRDGQTLTIKKEKKRKAKVLSSL